MGREARVLRDRQFMLAFYSFLIAVTAIGCTETGKLASTLNKDSRSAGKERERGWRERERGRQGDEMLAVCVLDMRRASVEVGVRISAKERNRIYMTALAFISAMKMISWVWR